MYKLANKHVRIWSSYASSRGGQKFIDQIDGCLTYWTWMPSLEHVYWELLPKLLTIADSYKGQHLQAKRTRLLTQVLLVTFYEDQIHIGASFSFMSIQNRMTLVPISSLEYIEITMSNGRPSWWCEVAI